MRAGGSAPTILNAANEIAVARFLRGEIAFVDIATVVEKALETIAQKMPSSLEEITAIDKQTRIYAEAA